MMQTHDRFNIPFLSDSASGPRLIDARTQLDILKIIVREECRWMGLLRLGIEVKQSSHFALLSILLESLGSSELEKKISEILESGREHTQEYGALDDYLGPIQDLIETAGKLAEEERLFAYLLFRIESHIALLLNRDPQYQCPEGCEDLALTFATDKAREDGVAQ